MTNLDDDDDDQGQITPSLCQGLLRAAFPGIELKSSGAIGRRLAYNAEFGEFHVTITTPDEGVAGKTIGVFRREVRGRKIQHEVEEFKQDEVKSLGTWTRLARGRVMGIMIALQQALEEPQLGSPPAKPLWSD